MNRLLQLLLSLQVGLLISSCLSTDSQQMIRISGNIEGLPDGRLDLVDARFYVIDSVTVKNGRFHLAVPLSKYPEPVFVGLQHYDSAGCKRLFNFKMSQLYNGQSWMQGHFLLEDGARICGKIVDFNPKDFSLPDSIKLVYPSEKVQGLQNSAMNNIAFDFSRKWDATWVDGLQDLIRKYPYSYYLLYQLRDNLAVFDDQQLPLLLRGFDKHLQESSGVRDIRRRLELRARQALSKATKLLNLSDEKEAIIDPATRVNMVILWASWCAPCRAEIPGLKQLYLQYAGNRDFGMVSVSLDEQRENWKKAVVAEAMPWKQLWISAEWTRYQQELFSFDGSIPTVIFTDSNGKIIQKFTGFDEKSLEKYRQFIEEHLASSPKQ